MPRHALEPLARTEVLLFESDKAYLIATYGTGWTEQVREAVRAWIKRKPKITIGDLIDD